MSDDLIKKSDAIEAITNHCENECYYSVDNWCPQCQREEFQEAINAVPSADRPQEWILCSERLPSDRKAKLVLLSSNRITIASYNEHIMSLAPYKPIGWGYDKYHIIDFEKEEVIAWMPLPEPWKGAVE